MMKAHALLSPSAAHRWINCAAAPRLEATVEDSGSDYAAEGTLAHAYCAKKLKEFLGLPTVEEEAEIKALQQYHTGEMDEYTDTYKTIVLERFNAARVFTGDAQLLVETKLDFGIYVPDAFGTADAINIADGVMEIIDFKYGKGVKVSAYQNPQMMIYALGAFEKFNFEYNITSVRMTIIQPRIDNLSEYLITIPELLAWAYDVLIPAAKKAYAGGSEQTPGEWCQFCKVKQVCRKYKEICKTAIAKNPDPRLLSPAEIAAEVLPMLSLVETWLSGAKEYSLQLALSGESLPGWKLVEGRSNRKITNADSVAALLNGEGYNNDQIYKPKELQTITELEKLVGKKHFAEVCKDFIDKPQGKPTLVPEDDKRPAINPAVDDFNGINVE